MLTMAMEHLPRTAQLTSEHYSRFSMGNDIADYNNDGQPDVITVDMLPPDEKT